MIKIVKFHKQFFNYNNMFDFRFKLVSVVNYTNDHYVTYIIRNSKQWELHDDNKRKIVNITNIDAVKNLRPHLLMYIKI